MSVVLLSALILTANPAADASVPAAVQPSKVEQASKGDRVTCRRERVIGSKVASRKICMTARDRDRAASAIQQDMGDLIKRNTGGATPQ